MDGSRAGVLVLTASLTFVGGCPDRPDPEDRVSALDMDAGDAALPLTCVPGTIDECIGGATAAPCTGARVCAADGSEYGPCQCEAPDGGCEQKWTDEPYECIGSVPMKLWTNRLCVGCGTIRLVSQAGVSASYATWFDLETRCMTAQRGHDFGRTLDFGTPPSCDESAHVCCPLAICCSVADLLAQLERSDAGLSNDGGGVDDGGDGSTIDATVPDGAGDAEP